MMIFYLPDNKEISGNRKELMDLKKMVYYGQWAGLWRQIFKTYNVQPHVSKITA